MINAESIRKTLVGNITYLGGSKISSVTFEETDQPRVDADGRMFLPKFNALWSEEEVKLYLYKVYHELGHLISPFDYWSDILKENKPKDRLKYIYNLVDDHAQERNMLGHFQGVDKCLLEGRWIFLGRNKQQITFKDEDEEKMYSLWLMDEIVRREWNPVLKRNPVYYIPHECEKWTDLIRSTYFTALEVSNTEESYLLSKKLHEMLFPDEESEEDESDEGEGEGSGDDEGGDDGDKEERVGKGGFPSPDSWEKVKARSMYHSEGVYKPRPVAAYDYQVEKWISSPEQERFKEYFESYKENHRFIAAITPLLGNTSHLAGEVRRLLLSRSQIRKVGGQRTGKLSSKNLYKFKQSSALFTQKEETLSFNTAVSLLIDYSGSMGGNKILVAGAAAVMLSSVLTPLGVNVEVAYFTEADAVGGPLHGIVQPFGSRPNKEEIVRRMSHGSVVTMQNADGESVDLAASRLYAQKNKRKVLVVLSDGAPCADNHGDLQTHLKNVVSEWEKRIEVYGIGIEDGSVRNYYSQHAVLHTASDLVGVLSNLISKKIII